MTIKVFISHQKADSIQAILVAQRLQTVHMIDTYVDVIDPHIAGSGEILTDHVRQQLGKCTQLLAVVSEATKESWWVPWEIGIATEKNFPLATYGVATLPEYLKKWPYLKSSSDLDAYAQVSKETHAALQRKRILTEDSLAKRSTTSDFYRTLRSRLGQ